MVNQASWMTDLGSVADNVPITQFPLPGSHDAVAYGTINEKSKTQGKSIKEQLEAGFRYFDLRVRVDNSIFFGHHGSDEVPDNQYCPSDPKPAGVASTIFEDIQAFSQAHPNEIIILNFYDATSVWQQSFALQDKIDFITYISSAFTLASPPSGNIPPTYGELKRNGTPIIALINDSEYFELEDSFDADFCQRNKIWLESAWLGQRYSEYRRLAWRSYQDLYEYTAKDQEDYLISERDLNKFWVSQTILGYDNASTTDGHSANYWGALEMNKRWIPTFKHWFAGRQWDGGTERTIPKPNVLLVDYAGVFGEFADEFSSLFPNAPVVSAPLSANFSTNTIQTSGGLSVIPGLFSSFNIYYGNSWVLYNAGGFFEINFFLANVATESKLVLKHLTSAILPDMGYAPIQITINGQVFLNSYDVARNHAGSTEYQTDEFPLGSMLQAGMNSIRIILQPDYKSIYWVQSLEIIS